MLEFIVGYWVEVLFSTALSLLGIAYKRLAKRIKEQDAIKLGIRELLRDRIIRVYNHSYDAGFCPIYALENAVAMYEQYHALGGNGTVTELLDRLKELPTGRKEGNKYGDERAYSKTD
ncbi:hypothetical protein [Hydrogenoanaerobacterium sp.]|uniref:hypothetical protein n=1 Tax=Hydrogenoanaerobacterium sp. TaxID=2953763 RepID=UPI00289BAF26|nr:hypothetical protein [Hydrogenoanaerobacterium sp.]